MAAPSLKPYLVSNASEVYGFVLPPRLPKLNGVVEHAHRTRTEEFYEVNDSTFDLAELRTKLLE